MRPRVTPRDGDVTVPASDPKATAATRKAQQQELRANIMAMRVGGATMQAIADAMQVSRATVFRHVKKALDRLAADELASTARYRALNLARLDRLLMAIWSSATSGKDIAVVREARNLITQENALLGLNAPIKIAHTDPTGTESAERWAVPVPPERDPQAWAEETRRMMQARSAQAARDVDELLESVAAKEKP